MAGNLIPRNCANLAERAAESTGLTPAATTFTRVSSSFGSGRGPSSNFKTSGPPYSCTTTAFIVGFAVCPTTPNPKPNAITARRLKFAFIRNKQHLPDHEGFENQLIIPP